MGAVPESKGLTRTTSVEAESLKLVSEACNPKFVSLFPLLALLIVGDTDLYKNLMFRCC